MIGFKWMLLNPTISKKSRCNEPIPPFFFALLIRVCPPTPRRPFLRRKSMLRSLLRILCPFACSCSLLVVAPPALSQATPPSADTFVSSATPRTSYGSSIVLVVQSGTTAYLQFNLSALPAGAQVSKATLRLFVDGVLKPGSFDIYQLNAPWSENTLTYNTPAPALGISATGGNPIFRQRDLAQSIPRDRRDLHGTGMGEREPHQQRPGSSSGRQRCGDIPRLIPRKAF